MLVILSVYIKWFDTDLIWHKNNYGLMSFNFVYLHF